MIVCVDIPDTSLIKLDTLIGRKANKPICPFPIPTGVWEPKKLPPTQRKQYEEHQRRITDWKKLPYKSRGEAIRHFVLEALSAHSKKV
jgi:hypothetical protein